MKADRRVFGRMPDGAVVEELTLRALGPGDDKYVCKIITYGGAVRSLTMPAGTGSPVDVVLGFDSRWRITGPRTNISGPWWGGTPTGSAERGSR